MLREYALGRTCPSCCAGTPRTNCAVHPQCRAQHRHPFACHTKGVGAQRFVTVLVSITIQLCTKAELEIRHPRGPAVMLRGRAHCRSCRSDCGLPAHPQASRTGNQAHREVCKLGQAARQVRASAAMDQTPAQAPAIDVDVAVVGGGPAGLTTALALKRACPDLKVHVLERARKLRPAGGSIAFGTPEILAALLAPVGEDVAQAIRDAGVPRSRFTARDVHGNAYIDNVGQENRAGFQIAWFDMQQALVPFLAQDEFSTGSGVAQVRQQDNGMMEISLVNGKTVTARLVVGADGNQSAVRSAYVCPDRRPFYVGATVWRFWLPLVNPHVEHHAYVTYSHQGKTFVMTNTAREGSASYASVLTTFPEERLEELNQTRYIQAAEESSATLQARIARCREAIGDTFPREIIDFVLDNAEPDGTLEHPMMALDPDFTWRRGMATLVGDAAHVMPPNFGQGTPMAMKDAVQLAASVRRHGLCPDALDEYERVQKAHLMPVWEGSAYSALYWYRDKIEEYDPFKLWGGGNKFTKAVDAALDSYSPPALV